MRNEELVNALRNYHKIVGKLDFYQESDNKRLDPLDDAWDSLFAMNRYINDRWDEIINEYGELSIIFSMLDEDDELEEEDYPNIRYPRKGYVDLLRFGRQLTEYFSRFQRFLPYFYNADDFHELRIESDTTYANLLDVYNAKYGNAYGARREPAHAA